MRQRNWNAKHSTALGEVLDDLPSQTDSVSIIVESHGILYAPTHSDCIMILKIFSYPGKLMAHGNAGVAQ
ncbi:hypothetical protein AO501_24500 [Mycobacterium gordonae]|uniref:Uncharacterized protein n=1 Tax=Mycobacterium gordonae TaxID=1778 RepID=A0A0Q2X0S9_MYCGO|nr:hypothetical protein AO501_24500 [Mycobacterium gordonae]